MVDGEDWLFPDKERDRAELEQQGLLFAQRYLVFGGPTADARAKGLLEYWTAIARKKRIPANASAQEYAAHNAFRELIEGIHAQIEFAQNGANQPQIKEAP